MCYGPTRPSHLKGSRHHAPNFGTPTVQVAWICRKIRGSGSTILNERMWHFMGGQSILWSLLHIFQGIRTPNPHDLRPCTVPTYSNHTFLHSDQTRWKYFSTGPTSPRSLATIGKSSLHLMSTSQMCTLSPHISRMLTRDLFAVANLVRYSGQT